MPNPSPRAALPSDLQPGDLLLFRKDFVDAQPASVPWRIACEAIALGESLFRPNPAYVHVGIVVGPNMDTIEELPQGCVEDTEILDARFDVVRLRFTSDASRDRVIAFCRDKLKTPYNWAGLGVIGLDRIFKTGIAEHANPATWVCSTLVAAALKAEGYDCWPGVNPSDVSPADYPGAGMRMVVQAGMLVGS